MREATFIRRNRTKWERYEHLSLKATELPAEELSAVYDDVLSDLAYVQAKYTDSSLSPYLNGIAQSFHEAIYFSRRKQPVREFVRMLVYGVPSIIVDARREILFSLLALALFTLLGVVRALLDFNAVEEVLGWDYVQMTIDNIEAGKPTDVYNMSAAGTMFYEIFLNNILVDLRMYGYGLIPFFGPIYFLWVNGVMLGEFHMVFFEYGVGLKAMAAIWIHGTLEMSALVVAGGAAIALGKSWVLTGGRNVKDSLKTGGLRSIKILASTFPLTLVAAILESYVTRHVEWPLAVRLSIILLSALFVIVYYVLLPMKVYRRQRQEKEYEGK